MRILTDEVIEQHAYRNLSTTQRLGGYEQMKLGVRGTIPGASLREKAEALQRTGFDGIELGPEYLNQPAEEILRQLSSTGIAVTAIVGSIKLLHPDSQERQTAIPLDRERFAMAKALGASAVIEVPVFGEPRFNDLPAGMSARDYAKQLLISSLKALAPDIERTGVTLLIEPLNRYETRFINRLEQGAEIGAAVGSPGVKLLADFFHMQIEERVIADALRKYQKYVGYIHLADSNRLEPGAGHTDFRAGFDALKSVGYDGWLTIESGLSGEPEDSLRRSRALISAVWDAASG
ncbi:sugar phosphate isomerase/epimerase [Candidatus Poribacteria bacterium]|nr:sugar phosphate isomerase/epimerase [Candidatus Poribacteria bacterium]